MNRFLNTLQTASKEAGIHDIQFSNELKEHIVLCHISIIMFPQISHTKVK